MSMSKKDFIALADEIKRNPSDFTGYTITHLADFCETQSRAFNRSRWLSYIHGECGPSGGKVNPEPARYPLGKCSCDFRPTDCELHGRKY